LGTEWGSERCDSGTGKGMKVDEGHSATAAAAAAGQINAKANKSATLTCRSPQVSVYFIR